MILVACIGFAILLITVRWLRAIWIDFNAEADAAAEDAAYHAEMRRILPALYDDEDDRS